MTKGIIYLSRQSEFIENNIFEIGYIKSTDLKKSKNEYILYLECNNPLVLGKNIKYKFNKSFTLKLISGNEYFEGDVEKMRKEFLEIYEKYEKPNNNFISEIKENKLINISDNLINILKVNNKITTIIINNKENKSQKKYKLTYFDNIDIFTNYKIGNHDKNKTDEDIVKEAIEKEICLVTKAGTNAQWYLKCPNKDLEKVRQKLSKAIIFNGKCPKGLYNILIELIV